VGVAVGVGVAVEVGDGLVTAPVQEVPLKDSCAGAALVPEYEPLKPKVTLAPVATEPLYPTLAAVTLSPDWVSVAFQIWVICWLPGNVQAAVHEVTALPRFVKDTLAVKPPDH
jgi:hypothetical protein